MRVGVVRRECQGTLQVRVGTVQLPEPQQCKTEVVVDQNIVRLRFRGASERFDSLMESAEACTLGSCKARMWQAQEQKNRPKMSVPKSKTHMNRKPAVMIPSSSVYITSLSSSGARVQPESFQ